MGDSARKSDLRGRLVAPDPGIDILGPAIDPALQVDRLAVAQSGQLGAHPGAADPMVAVDHQGPLAGGQILGPLLNPGQREELRQPRLLCTK